MQKLKTYVSSPLGCYYLVARVIKDMLRRYFCRQTVQMCPLSHPHKEPVIGRDVLEYWKYRSLRKPIGVVYTCITGGYDNLAEIARFGYYDPEWDYVCFTDNGDDLQRGRVGIWEVRALSFSRLDGTRNNRWHKMHPHVIFPNYIQSIYIDSNIDILSPWLFEEVKRRNHVFLLPKHPRNECIYQEYQDVLSGFKDSASLILRERALIRRTGMPCNYGFTENNILYRRHHESSIVMLMEDWWRMVVRYSKRDQLSLTWLLWRRCWRISDMTFMNARYQVDNFCVFLHKCDPARKGGV